MAAICVGMVVTTHIFYKQHKGKVTILFEDNEDDHHGDDDGDHQKNDHDDDQVRIFNDVRLEEHHKDLLLYDSNNRLVTTGHLGRLLSESLHP